MSAAAVQSIDGSSESDPVRLPSPPLDQPPSPCTNTPPSEDDDGDSPHHHHHTEEEEQYEGGANNDGGEGSSASSSSATGGLQLYGFHGYPEDGLDDVSPFVIKAITYLRLARWDFTYVQSSKHGMKSLPRGKLPVLVLEDGTTMVADAHNIITHLESRRPACDRLDAHLSPEQRAVGLMLRKAVEEDFYWCAIIQTRWVDDRGWSVTQKKYFGQVASYFQMYLNLFRNNVKNAYKGQGHGRRPRGEVVSIAKEEVDAFATLLGDAPFFLGSHTPTTIDCTMYSFLASVVRDESWYPFSPIRQHVRTKANLIDYVHRMDTWLLANTTPPPPQQQEEEEEEGEGEQEEETPPGM